MAVVHIMHRCDTVISVCSLTCKWHTRNHETFGMPGDRHGEPLDVDNLAIRNLADLSLTKLSRTVATRVPRIKGAVNELP